MPMPAPTKEELLGRALEHYVPKKRAPRQRGDLLTIKSQLRSTMTEENGIAYWNILVDYFAGHVGRDEMSRVVRSIFRVHPEAQALHNTLILAMLQNSTQPTLPPHRIQHVGFNTDDWDRILAAKYSDTVRSRIKAIVMSMTRTERRQLKLFATLHHQRSRKIPVVDLARFSRKPENLLMAAVSKPLTRGVGRPPGSTKANMQAQAHAQALAQHYSAYAMAKSAAIASRPAPAQPSADPGSEDPDEEDFEFHRKPIPAREPRFFPVLQDRYKFHLYQQGLQSMDSSFPRLCTVLAEDFLLETVRSVLDWSGPEKSTPAREPAENIKEPHSYEEPVLAESVVQSPETGDTPPPRRSSRRTKPSGKTESDTPEERRAVESRTTSARPSPAAGTAAADRAASASASPAPVPEPEPVPDPPRKRLITMQDVAHIASSNPALLSKNSAALYHRLDFFRQQEALRLHPHETPAHAIDQQVKRRLERQLAARNAQTDKALADFIAETKGEETVDDVPATDALNPEWWSRLAPMFNPKKRALEQRRLELERNSLTIDASLPSVAFKRSRLNPPMAPVSIAQEPDTLLGRPAFAQEPLADADVAAILYGVQSVPGLHGDLFPEDVVKSEDVASSQDVSQQVTEDHSDQPQEASQNVSLDASQTASNEASQETSQSQDVHVDLTNGSDEVVEVGDAEVNGGANNEVNGDANNEANGDANNEANGAANNEVNGIADNEAVTDTVDAGDVIDLVNAVDAQDDSAEKAPDDSQSDEVAFQDPVADGAGQLAADMQPESDFVDASEYIEPNAEATATATTGVVSDDNAQMDVDSAEALPNGLDPNVAPDTPAEPVIKVEPAEQTGAEIEAKSQQESQQESQREDLENARRERQSMLSQTINIRKLLEPFLHPSRAY